MQASTRRRPDIIAVAPAIAFEEERSRYWGLALIAACAASWATIFGAAKLLLALI
jgi:hypothetical protein